MARQTSHLWILLREVSHLPQLCFPSGPALSIYICPANTPGSSTMTKLCYFWPCVQRASYHLPEQNTHSMVLQQLLSRLTSTHVCGLLITYIQIKHWQTSYDLVLRLHLSFYERFLPDAYIEIDVHKMEHLECHFPETFLFQRCYAGIQ